jgi:DNA-binding MarR family transcriptional regulator
MDKKKVVLNTVEMISQLMGELESIAFEQEGFADITMNQMRYLETIARLGEPTFGELAEALGVTRPSVSSIVKKLIQQGYLVKVQSQQDGRMFFIHLSETGKRFNQLHSEVHHILAKRITENLNREEVDSLADLLGKLTEI